ncbi:kinase-like domain-containing protein [Lasiosphaeris hirsuta]|uniref:Kinase-like domain-containing protein n=1 Tax=Lasiosphaeris hirsuta TaxID=260670 RepID=A0AA40AYU6_9PEZI|nr:kinase-like domain-containing protein [Lasiosphaeris hirsuta]
MWTPHQVVSFARSQWEVLAPFLSRSKPREYRFRELPDKMIMPFTALESIGAGGYGHADIYHGEIHPQHHNFPVGLFVVKSIRINGPEADQFEKEVRMLRRVCANEHIVDPLEAYRHRGAYHLLLPRAECDLEVYWKEVDHGGLRTNTAFLLSWMAQQCGGLASGLNQIHHHLTTSMSSLFQRTAERLSLGVSRKRAVLPSPDAPRRHKFHGAHGDVKPSNILWFPGPTANGTLKITDFGAGDYSDTESTRRSSDPVPFTPSYQPPERALDIDDEIDVSWAYDVWRLGCVYSEFATWYGGGYPMVDKFTRSRRPAHADRGGAPFFELGADGKAVVKPAVEEVKLIPPSSTVVIPERDAV